MQELCLRHVRVVQGAWYDGGWWWWTALKVVVAQSIVEKVSVLFCGLEFKIVRLIVSVGSQPHLQVLLLFRGFLTFPSSRIINSLSRMTAALNYFPWLGRISAIAEIDVHISPLPIYTTEM